MATAATKTFSIQAVRDALEYAAMTYKIELAADRPTVAQIRARAQEILDTFSGYTYADEAQAAVEEAAMEAAARLALTQNTQTDEPRYQTLSYADLIARGIKVDPYPTWDSLHARILVDTARNAAVYWDGGASDAPEDKTLDRDLSDFVAELNRLAAEKQA